MISRIINNNRTIAPSISIIIPTFNRYESIKNALLCLNNQSWPKDDFEVIVIDDSSSDGTFEKLNLFINKLDINVRISHCSRQGPGKARNIGLNLAIGEIILFTDSDCEPKEDWIARMLESLLNKKTVVSGKVEIPTESGIVPKSINFIMHSWIGAMGRKWNFFGFVPGIRFRTMNAALYKETILKIGGFKCSGDYYGEDTEVGELLLMDGAKFIFNRNAIVFHRERRSISNYLYESGAKGIASISMILSKSIPFRGIFIMPLLLIITLLGIISGIFLNSFLLKACLLILILYYFVILSYSIRFFIISKSFSIFICSLTIVSLLHLAYGIGIIIGLFSVKPPIKDSTGPALNIRLKSLFNTFHTHH